MDIHNTSTYVNTWIWYRAQEKENVYNTYTYVKLSDNIAEEYEL